MFAIAVRFPTGRYYAASHTDHTRPEWPPHPDRLFSALVATCYQACGGNGRSALEWLEQQGPPSLAVERPSVPYQDGRTMLAMVRTNDAEAQGKEGIKVLPNHRKPQPRWFPSIAAETPVYFIWPHTAPDEDTEAALATLTTHMTYLGSSKSPVIAWIEANPPTPTLHPDTRPIASANRVMLRVVTAGRLAELDSQYKANLRPQPGHQEPYCWVTRDAQTERPAPHPSGFGDMFIFARTGGPAPSPEATLTVTAALRNALLAVGDERASNASGADVPELLHGHGPKGNPHCAFVALPHVEAPYADGHLLGVAVVFPYACDAQQRRAALRVLSKLEYVQTPAGRIRVIPLVRQTLDSPLWGLQPERWCGPMMGAATWTSVTPVLFDRFPRPNRGGILGAAQALARHAGLPEPVEAIPAQMSPLSGVPKASAYRIRRTEDDSIHYVSHLTITFDRPVTGPVMLGAGRYFGLGLFVPYHIGNG